MSAQGKFERWPYARLQHSPDDGAELAHIRACYAEMDRLAEELAASKERLPDCPPCDMGENTPCICASKLVPKEWLDEVIAERDASKEREKALVEGLAEIDAANEESGMCYSDKLHQAVEKLRAALAHQQPTAKEGE